MVTKLSDLRQLVELLLTRKCSQEHVVYCGGFGPHFTLRLRPHFFRCVMATPQTIIDQATSLLRVRTSGVTFSTDDSNKNADVFIALKNLINEYGEDGLLNIPAPAALGSTLDIPDGAVRGMAYNLAVEVSAEFGIDPAPVVFEIAKETKNRMESEITLDISVNSSDLSWTHSRYQIDTDII